MKKADIQRLSIDRYDYPLPDERIAKYPLPDRDGSKLLVYDAGLVTSTLFRSLPEQLPPGSLLLFNDTRVIHARLLFHKVTGARGGLLLVALRAGRLRGELPAAELLLMALHGGERAALER